MESPPRLIVPPSPRWNSWHLLGHPYSICKEYNVFHVPHQRRKKKPRGWGRRVSKCFTVSILSLIHKTFLRSLFTLSSPGKLQYIFAGYRTLPWQFSQNKNSPHWRLRRDLAGSYERSRHSDKKQKHGCAHTLMQPFPTDPKKYFSSPKERRN